jgi:Na+/H+-translocating membrane pyrophosphatase
MCSSFSQSRHSPNSPPWSHRKLYNIQAIIFPLGLGFAFGPKVVAGFIPGIIVSGLHLAISGANSGSAWNSAYKFIESGQMME